MKDYPPNTERYVERQKIIRHYSENGREENTTADNLELPKMKGYWLSRIGQIAFHSQIINPPCGYDKNEAF